MPQLGLLDAAQSPYFDKRYGQLIPTYSYVYYPLVFMPFKIQSHPDTGLRSWYTAHSRFGRDLLMWISFYSRIHFVLFSIKKSITGVLGIHFWVEIGVSKESFGVKYFMPCTRVVTSSVLKVQE